MPLRRRSGGGLDVWPGYVDALSTLLMVITFVLLVFVLAQALLSVALSRKDTELATLSQQVAQLTDMLSLEKTHTAELSAAVAGLNRALQAADAARQTLRGTLATTHDQLQAATRATDTLRAQATTLAAQLSDAQTVANAASARMATLQTQADAAAVSADTLTRDQAQMALLNQQVAQLRLQLAAVSAALDLSQSTNQTKTAQITDLTARLNVALANKVTELQKYRSEFFGRLRVVLAGRPGIAIVGDRFVFQSEVLFPVGSAQMSPSGQTQIRALAASLLQIAGQIPPSLPWVMRVDGHADRQKLAPGGAFTSNWELSAERAINVVRYLIAQGVPQTHLAAAAFGDTQPLSPGTTPADYARNRRIELRLTDR